MSWLPSQYAWAQPQADAPGSLGGTPWWQTVGNGLGSNSGMLLGLGAGLLSGNLGAVPGALAQGIESERSRRIQSYQLNLAMSGRKAADDYVTKMGHPELKGAFASVGDAIAANKPTTFAPGDTARSGFGDTIDTGTSGGFAGTGMDAQNWNTVMLAQSGRIPWSDPKAQAAWAQLNTPKITYQQTPQGLVPVMQQPNLPAGWGPPQQSQQGPAQVSYGGNPDVAPIGGIGGAGGGTAASPAGNGVAVGQPLPGTKQPGNESQLRYKTITNILQSEIPNLQKNWKGLTDPWSQAAGMLPGDAGRVFQSPTYKRAFDSVTASIANILYALSGASSNPGEVMKQGQVLMPHFGDDPETQRASFDRMKTYMQSVADGTGDPDVIAQTQAALQQLNFDTAGGGKAPAVSGKTSTGAQWSFTP